MSEENEDTTQETEVEETETQETEDESQDTEGEQGEGDDGAEGGEEETEDAEGDDDSGEAVEEGSEESKSSEITDETEIQVDDEPVSVEDLKDAYRFYTTAVEKVKAVEQRTQEINQVVEQIKEKPMDTMVRIFTQVLGDSQKAYNHVVGLAEKVVAKHFEFENKSEEEKQAIINQQELESLRARVKAQEEKEKLSKAEVEELELTKSYGETIITALKTDGLVGDEQQVADVAEIMLRASDAGLDVTPAQAVKRYKKVIAKKKEDFLKTLDPDELPSEVREKLRKKDLEKVKRGKAKKSERSEPAKEKPSKYVVVDSDNMRDFLYGGK